MFLKLMNFVFVVFFRDCKIIKDPQTLKSKGYGFVSFVKKVVSITVNKEIPVNTTNILVGVFFCGLIPDPAYCFVRFLYLSYHLKIRLVISCETHDEYLITLANSGLIKHV